MWDLRSSFYVVADCPDSQLTSSSSQTMNIVDEVRLSMCPKCRDRRGSANGWTHRQLPARSLSGAAGVRLRKRTRGADASANRTCGDGIVEGSGRQHMCRSRV